MHEFMRQCRNLLISVLPMVQTCWTTSASAVDFPPMDDVTPSDPTFDKVCPVEENGFTGVLKVDYLFYAGEDHENALVLVASDEEFAKMKEKLNCHSDGAGLVKLEGAASFQMRLQIGEDGLRFVGTCSKHKRRVIVLSQSEANRYQ